MYVIIKIPEVGVSHLVFASYWLTNTFGPGVSGDYQVRALATTFVRLVESAVRRYRQGVAGTQEYWGTHDKIAFGAIQEATSHFESCVSDMHRAINCFTRLRRHQRLGALAAINNRRPVFVSDQVHDQLRNARNEIHHMERMVMDGEVSEGQSISIRADGPEVIHPSEDGQTIKTIDRLAVGRYEILFSDVAEWLAEMAEFCELMTSASRVGK